MKRLVIAIPFLVVAACESRIKVPYGVPDPPTEISVVAGSGRISVDWTPVPGATSYDLYLGFDPEFGPASANVTAPGVQPGHFFSGVDGTVRYIRIASLNDAGVSDPSPSLAGKAAPIGALGLVPSIEPVAEFEGDEEIARLGTAVAIGRIDGDAYADLVVLAGTADGATEDDIGMLYVYPGSATGIGATPSRTIEGEEPAGWSRGTLAIGDLNGDGYGDVVLGAQAFSGTTGANTGKVYAYFGSATGLAAAPGWTATGTVAGGYFGWSVTAGDLDGNGIDDVVVGAPYVTDTFSGEGRVYVYYGTTAGPAAAAAWMADGNQTSAQFGSAVSATGDADHDGLNDLLVGARFFTGTFSQAGKADLFRGRPGPLALTPDMTLPGTQASAYAGSSVAFSDVDADGYDDVIVGEPFQDSSYIDEGRISLYRGAVNGVQLFASGYALGGAPSAHLGETVAAAGDVNGDGYDDVLAGAPLYTFTSGNEGRLCLFLGDEDTLIGPAPSFFANGAGPSAQFGFSLASGDLDGDGSSDIASGAPFYSGSVNNEGHVVVFRGPGARGPRATAGSSLHGVTGAATALRGAGFEPANAGLHICRVDWGDGTVIGINPCTPQLLARSAHTYALPGEFPVRVRVADAQGIFGEALTSATVVE